MCKINVFYVCVNLVKRMIIIDFAFAFYVNKYLLIHFGLVWVGFYGPTTQNSYSAPFIETTYSPGGVCTLA